MKKQRDEIFNVTKVERKKVKSLKNTVAALKKAKTNKSLFAIITILSILSVTVSVFEALLAKELLFAVTGAAWERLIKFALVYAAAEILSRGLINLQSYYSMKYNSITMQSLQIQGFDRVNSLSASCFANNNTSTYISRIGESGKISNTILYLLHYTERLASNLAYSIVFLTTAPILFLCLFFFYAIRAIINEFIVPTHQAMKKKNINLADSARNIMMESVRGALDVKGLNMQNNLANQHHSIFRRVEKNNINIYAWHLRRRFPLNSVCSEINNLVFMLLAAYFGIQGTMTAAAILFAWTYKGYVNSLFFDIVDIRDELANVELSASRYMELYDESRFPLEKFGDKTIDVTGNIEFKNVTYYYEKSQPVLNGVSFNVEANKVTAFVGKTGCGKSTTLSLIARFFDPVKGTIKLDGTNIKKLTKDCLRSSISYVQQSPYIFNATFKQNLKLVKPDATNEEIIEACKKSEIHDFILTTEKGYDTLLGENGINLSGGQKQRLAIARAFLNSSKIIMFDESTSSLDNDNQAKIQRAISNLAKDHTILVVAHRLSTIINADKIIFIKDHKVHAEGTHNELMKTCVEYNELYTIENQKDG